MAEAQWSLMWEASQVGHVWQPLVSASAIGQASLVSVVGLATPPRLPHPPSLIASELCHWVTI